MWNISQCACHPFIWCCIREAKRNNCWCCCYSFFWLDLKLQHNAHVNQNQQPTLSPGCIESLFLFLNPDLTCLCCSFSKQSARPHRVNLLQWHFLPRGWCHLGEVWQRCPVIPDSQSVTAPLQQGNAASPVEHARLQVGFTLSLSYQLVCWNYWSHNNTQVPL